jgi:hypothetical protein
MKKIILIAFAAVLFSCSSDDSSNDDNNTSGVAFVKGKMDNVAFDYTFNNTANDTYLYNALSGFSGLGFDRWYYYGGSLTKFTPPTFAPAFYISWNNMFFGQNGDEAGESAAFFTTVGTLPSNFLTVAQDDAHNPGLDIAFEKEDGTYYSSKDGSQTGSALSVTNYTQNTTNGVKTMTVVGTFSCKLYNTDDPTDVIVVTDGSFKLILSEFQ